MTRRLRRGRLEWRRDDGFTLTEMIVVMFVLGIVLAGVQTTLITTQRTVGENVVRVDQTQQGRLAMESMTKNLRTAVLPSQLSGTCSGCNLAAFIQGTATAVYFYANINNDANVIGPSRVSYVVNSSGDLVETVQAPNAHAPGDYNYQYCTPGPGCPVNTRVLARGVRTTKPIFTYYDYGGTQLGSGTLSASDLALVDSIDVVLSVKTSTSRVPATTFTQRVTLPNADAIAQPSPSP